MASTTLIAQNTNFGIRSKRDATTKLVTHDVPDPAPAVQAIAKDGKEPVIAVNPMEFIEEHLTPQITTQTLTITNNGTTPLEWDITVNTGAAKSSEITPVDAEVYPQMLAERQAAKGILSSAGRAPYT